MSDSIVAKEIYQEAIRSQCHSFYTDEQIEAWSAIAILPGILDRFFSDGIGWVSCVEDQVVAFAIRYPLNHLALLYCTSHFSRRGHGQALVERIELDAKLDQQETIFTEASLLSCSLLLRCGWQIVSPQSIKIGGVLFNRFLMAKSLGDQ